MNIKLTEIQKGYTAGLIDGEGCIYTWSNKNKIPLSIGLVIVNTDKRLIVWLIENIGGKFNSAKGKCLQKKRNSNAKVAYHWRIFGKELELLLNEIRPFLILKKEQAKLALDFIKTGQYYNTSIPSSIILKRKEIVKRMHILNKRGKNQQLNLDFDIVNDSQLIIKGII